MNLHDCPFEWPSIFLHCLDAINPVLRADQWGCTALSYQWAVCVIQSSMLEMFSKSSSALWYSQFCTSISSAMPLHLFRSNCFWSLNNSLSADFFYCALSQSSCPPVECIILNYWLCILPVNYAVHLFDMFKGNVIWLHLLELVSTPRL